LPSGSEERTLDDLRGVSDPAPNWFKRLQQRWGVNARRAAIILLVFICTGFTVMFLKRPVVRWIVGEGEQPLLFTVLYYVLILPVYNVFLLLYGALLGQFSFFWNFEKRLMKRLIGRRRPVRQDGPGAR
jgi:hypothetical protein